jgi:hypothetical protein
LLLSGNFEPGWRDGKAFTERASAWSAQSVPFPKDEPAIKATGRFHDEALQPGRSRNMPEVIQNLSFFDMEDL